MKAKQIEWEEYLSSGGYGWWEGFSDGNCLYTIERCYDTDAFSIKTHLTFAIKNIASCGTLDQAKQACQDHLQAYVDGLYCQLQQLTEKNK